MDIKEYLEQYHGDLIFERHRLYDELLAALYARTKIYKSFDREILAFAKAKKEVTRVK